MAGSPKYKVFDRDGTYQASCKEPEAAAALVSLYGDGSQVKLDHRYVLFTEGSDGRAGDSYDDAAALMLGREQEIHRQGHAKRYAAATHTNGDER